MLLKKIVGHRLVDGIYELQVLYYTGELEYHPFTLIQADDPLQTAQSVQSISNPKSKFAQKYGRWSRHFLRKLCRVVRRFSSIMDDYESPQIGKLP